jgi:hypothetical protein
MARKEGGEEREMYDDGSHRMLNDTLASPVGESGLEVSLDDSPDILCTVCGMRLAATVLRANVGTDGSSRLPSGSQTSPSPTNSLLERRS